MSNDIDFNQLSLRDTLDLAIYVEEEAKDRYDEFAEQMEAHHTDEVAKFFRFMAANEVKHAQKLSEQRRGLFGGEPSTSDPSILFDVEAPEYGKVRAFMSVRAALEVVLQLRGEAGARQLEDVEIGLAQSWRGVPTTSGAVAILSS